MRHCETQVDAPTFSRPIFFILSDPPRHADEADPVLDDVEDFTLAEVLSVLLAQVGRGRVQTGIDLGLPTSVIGVTDRTMVGEVIPGLSDIERG